VYKRLTTTFPRLTNDGAFSLVKINGDRPRKPTGCEAV